MLKLQHMVFCTEFLVGGGLESRCVGRVYGLRPKYVELWIQQ